MFGLSSSALTLCFFFFQAEDGIRDHCVTGVQTCALPICREHRPPPNVQPPRRGPCAGVGGRAQPGPAPAGSARAELAQGGADRAPRARPRRGGPRPPSAWKRQTDELRGAPDPGGALRRVPRWRARVLRPPPRPLRAGQRHRPPEQAPPRRAASGAREAQALPRRPKLLARRALTDDGAASAVTGCAPPCVASGSQGGPEISRAPRPCVTKLNAHRMSTKIRFWKPIRYQRWTNTHMSHAGKPLSFSPLTSATARARPMVARFPLSWYRKGGVRSSRSRRRITFAA